MDSAFKPAKVILLDFDGVLRLWPIDVASIEEDCGLPKGAITSCAFEPALLHPAILGTCSDELWRARVASQLLTRFPQSDAQRAVKAWSEPVGELDESVLQLLKKFRDKARLVLSTNATSRLQADLDALGISELFSAVANSSELGCIKPDAVYFRKTLAIAGASAERCLFIDDSMENVQSASALGIRSLHYCCSEAMLEFMAGNT